MRRRLLLLVVALAAVTTACTANQLSSKSHGMSASALPDKLPAITNQASVEPTLRSLIALGAAHAVGAPDSDRHPRVMVTSGFGCGVKIKAMACPPDGDPDGKVTIYINPSITWEEFREPMGHGGGNVPVQNAALGAVATYLAIRDLQRNHPKLLEDPTQDAAVVLIGETALCKNGEVYAGVKDAMSGELAQLWQNNASLKRGAFFLKGEKGKC